MMVAQEECFVGIDVSKAELVAAIEGQPGARTFTNDHAGIGRCLTWLRGIAAKTGEPVRVGMEPTGGYEWPLWAALDEAGFDARQLPSSHIHAYARLHGQLAKTDRQDAHIIASFFAYRPEAGRRIPSKALRMIKALATKRRQLITMRKALDCQMKQQTEESLISMDQALRSLLNEQIATLDTKLASLIDHDDALAHRASLLRSIPGIGPVVTATLIAEMPELGTLTEKRAAALVGLAPFARDSGKSAGKRFIRGGRTIIRNVLYQAAIVAARHHPELSEVAATMKARGKPHKLVITAIARRLITLANQIVKRDAPWQKRPA